MPLPHHIDPAASSDAQKIQCVLVYEKQTLPKLQVWLSLDIEEQRKDAKENTDVTIENLDVQIFQKLRCTLCSLPAKQTNCGGLGVAHWDSYSMVQLMIQKATMPEATPRLNLQDNFQQTWKLENSIVISSLRLGHKQISAKATPNEMGSRARENRMSGNLSGTVPIGTASTTSYKRNKTKARITERFRLLISN